MSVVTLDMTHSTFSTHHRDLDLNDLGTDDLDLQTVDPDHHHCRAASGHSKRLRSANQSATVTSSAMTSSPVTSSPVSRDQHQQHTLATSRGPLTKLKVYRSYAFIPSSTQSADGHPSRVRFVSTSLARVKARSVHLSDNIAVGDSIR